MSPAGGETFRHSTVASASKQAFVSTAGGLSCGGTMIKRRAASGGRMLLGKEQSRCPAGLEWRGIAFENELLQGRRRAIANEMLMVIGDVFCSRCTQGCHCNNSKY